MTLKRRSRTVASQRAVQHGHLAAMVAARRQELGLSQVELGDLAGVSYRIVHNVESGRTGTSLERVVAILDTLGLHLSIERGGSESVVAGESLAEHFGVERTGAVASDKPGNRLGGSDPDQALS